MLEEQQDELRAMFSKLEADRDMELEERQKLEEEIRMKQDEIEQVRNVVEEKDEETRRLQDEMSDAKRQLEVQSITSSCGKTFYNELFQKKISNFRNSFDQDCNMILLINLNKKCS